MATYDASCQWKTEELVQWLAEIDWPFSVAFKTYLLAVTVVVNARPLADFQKFAHDRITVHAFHRLQVISQWPLLKFQGNPDSLVDARIVSVVPGRPASLGRLSYIAVSS